MSSSYLVVFFLWSWIEFSTRTSTTGLICRHTIDYVTIDVHKTIYIVLTKHWGTPWWWFLREPKHVGIFIVTLILFRVDITSNVHLLDFNKRILILKMHGANIKKKMVWSMFAFTEDYTGVDRWHYLSVVCDTWFNNTCVRWQSLWMASWLSTITVK
jgi:hypothetical protein